MGKVRFKFVYFALVLISVILTILSLNRNAERFDILNLGHDLPLLIAITFLSHMPYS